MMFRSTLAISLALASAAPAMAAGMSNVDYLIRIGRMRHATTAARDDSRAVVWDKAAKLPVERNAVSSRAARQARMPARAKLTMDDSMPMNHRQVPQSEPKSTAPSSVTPPEHKMGPGGMGDHGRHANPPVTNPPQGGSNRS